MSYDYSKIKVYLCTPCYGGMVAAEYMRSVCQLTNSFTERGIKFELRTLSNDSLVTRARACLVATFLADPEATHLFFIDADISFNAKSVYRLLAADKEVVGGAYPMKSVNWAAVKEVLKENPDASEEELVNKSASYVINVHSSENDITTTGKVEDGFAKVANIGTGFLMIQRQVFDKMIKAYPDSNYRNDIPSFRGRDESKHMYTFFDTWCHPDSKRYLSEDYAFCQKWIDIGGIVWADLMCPLHHRGNFVFKGSAIDHFRKNIQTNK